MQGQRTREQTDQDDERRFDHAGRNTMRSESKRFSGTAIRYVGEVQILVASKVDGTSIVFTHIRSISPRRQHFSFSAHALQAR